MEKLIIADSTSKEAKKKAPVEQTAILANVTKQIPKQKPARETD
jgi:hypothetical protein